MKGRRNRRIFVTFWEYITELYHYMQLFLKAYLTNRLIAHIFSEDNRLANP